MNDYAEQEDDEMMIRSLDGFAITHKSIVCLYE